MTLFPDHDNPGRPDEAQPELPLLPADEDDSFNLSDTIVLRHLLDVDYQIPDTLYFAPNGNMHYNLRPLSLDVASLRTHLHGRWGATDLNSGKAVIEQLLFKAGYSLEYKPRIHNVILFAPRNHKNSEAAAPDRLTTLAVGFLKNKNLVAADGKFILINPPMLYDLVVRTIALMYPPFKDQVISVVCAADDVDAVIDAIEQEMVKPGFDSWIASVAPTGKLQFPRMK